MASASDSQLGEGLAGATSSGSTVGAFAKSSVVLAGNPFEGSGSARSRASAHPAGASESLAVACFGNLYDDNAFPLWAHTALLISVDALLTADAPDAATSDSAYAYLRLTLASLDGEVPQFGEQLLSANAGGFFYPAHDVQGGHLEVSFSDTSDLSMNDRFHGFVQSLADSQAPAAAVPEPASGALMPGGLAAPTALRRRRAR